MEAIILRKDLDIDGNIIYIFLASYSIDSNIDDKKAKKLALDKYHEDWWSDNDDNIVIYIKKQNFIDIIDIIEAE